MVLNRAVRLAPVVDMAEKAEREAAMQMGKAQNQLRVVESKLADLEGYLQGYQQQWISEGKQGVSGQWLVNYQRFLAQLDTVIVQQRQTVLWHRTNLDKLREAWQQRYARLEGLRRLVQRYIDEARQAEDKREQKLLDELAQRLTHHRVLE
jgi:flagellar FliJ protein